MFLLLFGLCHFAWKNPLQFGTYSEGSFVVGRSIDLLFHHSPTSLSRVQLLLFSTFCRCAERCTGGDCELSHQPNRVIPMSADHWSTWGRTNMIGWQVHCPLQMAESGNGTGIPYSRHILFPMLVVIYSKVMGWWCRVTFLIGQWLWYSPSRIDSNIYPSHLRINILT